MTLVLSVHGRDTLWVVADRRLSYGGRRRPVDDAVKLMNLQTTDGVAVLAYAGLGATSVGTQPSEWMSAVLRGRGGLSLEEALGVLAEVATRELPRHLAMTPAGMHSIIAPAFIKGVGQRLYTIDNSVDRRTGTHWYRYTSHQLTMDPLSPSQRLGLAGTGGFDLYRRRGSWRRPLFDLVKAHDRSQISAETVADALARLCHTAHETVRDGTVGPRSIVMWRRRRDARTPGPGGGHRCYSDGQLDAETAAIPTIANGMDVVGIAGIIWDLFSRQIQDPSFSLDRGLDVDPEEIDRLLGELPDAPDERLR